MPHHGVTFGQNYSHFLQQSGCVWFRGSLVKQANILTPNELTYIILAIIVKLFLFIYFFCNTECFCPENVHTHWSNEAAKSKQVLSRQKSDLRDFLAEK